MPNSVAVADPLKEIRSVARHPRMSSLQIHAEKRPEPRGHGVVPTATGRARSAQVVR
jgi:hypothetical protein